jgi:hypothetical protein
MLITGTLLKAVRKDVSPLTRAIYKLEAQGKAKNRSDLRVNVTK